jgi:hypothetical protein
LWLGVPEGWDVPHHGRRRRPNVQRARLARSAVQGLAPPSREEPCAGIDDFGQLRTKEVSKTLEAARRFGRHSWRDASAGYLRERPYLKVDELGGFVQAHGSGRHADFADPMAEYDGGGFGVPGRT